MRHIPWIMVLLSLTLGCGEGAKPPTPPAKAVSDTLPASLALATKPDGATSVYDTKQSAKVGDQVVVRARVGGSADPFVDGRAMMHIADMDNILDCGQKKDDTCKTPADY